MTIREGKWDCKTCGRTGNRGPDSYCGSCGSTRPDNVQFYLPEDAAEVTDEKLIAEANAGADWKCSYCSAQNNAFDSFCVSCGNKRNAEQGDISLQEKEIRFDSAESSGTASGQALTPEKKPMSRKLKIGIISGVAAVLLLFILGMLTTTINVTVTGFEYSAKVLYEEYKPVTEEDWSLPPTAQKLAEFRAIHHYDKVPDGYVTKTRDVQVKVGEKRVKVGTKDMGNGYFKDVYENRPVYETRSETYTETKYRDVPVYRMKYRYKMMKWVAEKPFEFSGSGKETPFTSKEDELKRYPDRFRNVKTEAVYFLTVKDDNGEPHKDDVKYETWEKASLNSSLKGEESTIFGFFYGINE